MALLGCTCDFSLGKPGGQIDSDGRRSVSLLAAAKDVNRLVQGLCRQNLLVGTCHVLMQA